MTSALQRKTILIFSLAIALMLALGAVEVSVLQDTVLQERLGVSYYVLGLAIIACVLLVVAGYVWDRGVVQRVRSLGTTVAEVTKEAAPSAKDDPDDIIKLARSIERMARDLQRTEANYRAIVEDLSDLICRYKPDGTLTFVNGAYSRVMGRPRQELIGTQFPWTHLHAGDSAGPWTRDREHTDSRGYRRCISWTVRSIRDSDGAICEYQAVGHDITVRKEAESALVRAKDAAEAADRTRSEFLAAVSHEIRTPINGVIGFADLLSKSSLDADQREQLALIRLSGEALEKLVASLQELSELETGSFAIASRPFELRTCLDETLVDLRTKAAAAGLKLEVQVDPGLPATIVSDDKCLRNVLTQLVGNALKFTERGTIKVAVASQGEGPRRKLQVEVRDTGIGIEADELPRLFRPFYRAGHPTQHRGAGIGLGLVTARKICEALGGGLTVKSKPGEGSVFEFSIGYVTA